MYVYVKANNLNNIGCIELSLFYPKNVLTYQSASAEDLNNGQSTCANGSNGVVSLQSISLNGISGSGNLWCIAFSVSQDSELKNYSLVLAAGTICNSSFENVSVTTKSSSFKVESKIITTKNFEIYGYTDKQAYLLNEEVEINFYSGNLSDLSAANFELSFDYTSLQLISFDLTEEFKNYANGHYEYNNIDGFSSITFASLNGINCYTSIAKAKFKVLINESIDKNVRLHVTSAYDSSLLLMSCSDVNQTVTIVKQDIERKANIYINGYDGFDKEFTVAMFAPGESNLAAADFVVNYDSTKLEFVEVVKYLESDYVIVNPDNGNGIIKFSFIRQTGVTEDSPIVRIKFKPKGAVSTIVFVSGSNLVDTNIQSVNVSFSNGDVKTTHQYHTYSAQAATYDEVGWDEYKECENCGDTNYVEIPKLTPTYADVTITHNVEFGNNFSLYYYFSGFEINNCSKIWLSLEKQRFNSDGSSFTRKSSIITSYTTETSVTNVTRCVFVFDGISATELGDQIDTYLYFELDGIRYISKLDSYSIKTYAYNRLQKSQSPTFKSLLVDVLNYASSAQEHFKYNTSHLVNADLTQEQKLLGTQNDLEPSGDSSVTNIQNEKAHINAKNVEFGNSTILHFYYKLDDNVDTSKVVAKFTYINSRGNNVIIEVPFSKFVYDSTKKRYDISLNNLAITEVCCSITSVILEDNIQISETVVYSIEVYAKNRLNNSTSDTFKQLLKDMLKYNKTAVAHFC